MVLPAKKKVTKKPVSNKNMPEAKEATPDLKIIGKPDDFVLLCKVYSVEQNWMKSTKAKYIPNIGCLVQVTTEKGSEIAEALTFVPGVVIIDDENGGKKLIAAGDARRR